jgi:hypothetical protein
MRLQMQRQKLQKLRPIKRIAFQIPGFNEVGDFCWAAVVYALMARRGEPVA